MNLKLTLLLTIYFTFDCIAVADKDLLSSANHKMTERAKQIKRLSEEQKNCLEKLNQTEIIEDIYCPIIWDGALCWPNTRINTTAEQQCPTYVFGFNRNGMAYKTCTENGTWFYNHETNNSWTDYTYCTQKNSSGNDGFNLILVPHIANFRIISKIGYSVSFGTLLIAFFILTFVKRLRCPRNNLHLQLFASFMIRSFMFLIKNIFVSTRASQDLQLEADQSSLSYANYDEQFSVGSFANEIPTISCKIFTIIWHYSLVANYNWILMEGLYLHNLIFLHIFNDNSSIMKYIILGWGLPILCIVPWAVVRALYEDTLCWTTNKNIEIFWIIRGPISATIVLNFIFFIFITRVVFMKMFSTSVVNYARQYRYRTWFKSTLILVPLFGVHYMFLLVFSSLSSSYDILEIIWLYIDLLFSSFQGCVVALLYCFCNGEVQQEVRKVWQAWRSNRSSTSIHSHSNHSTTHHSYIAQSLTYLSRGRNSFLSTGDNNVITKKEVLNNHSRSPSPLRNQFQVTNALISHKNEPKIQLEPSNLSSFDLISDKQNSIHNLNLNTSTPVDSKNESQM